jgi:hypothetical protein
MVFGPLVRKKKKAGRYIDPLVQEKKKARKILSVSMKATK